MATTDEDPILLASREPFSQGGNRFCFVSPHDPSVCLKVDQPQRSPERRRRRKAGISRIRPLYYFDENAREAEALAKLHRHAPGGRHPNLPRTFGLVQTDLGPAHATELIRDSDGRISATLEMHLLRFGIDPPVSEAVNHFKTNWLITAPFTRELLPHNFVVKLGPGDNRLVLIDGYGRKHGFPQAPIVWRRKRAVARLKNLDRRIRDFLSRMEIGSNLPDRLKNLDRSH